MCFFVTFVFVSNSILHIQRRLTFFDNIDIITIFSYMKFIKFKMKKIIIKENNELDDLADFIAFFHRDIKCSIIYLKIIKISLIL